MKLAVVVLRNLSAGWLGAYGNEWVATPNLDRLAAEGVVFERHIAATLDGQSESYASDVKRFDDLVPPWTVPPQTFAVYAEESDAGPLEPVANPTAGAFDRDDLAAWDALRCSYAALLTRLDAKLGPLFDELRQAGRTILVTSDRGFALGEHGTVGDGPAYVERVHLPLIVRFPEAVLAGERVDAFTQPIDLAEFDTRDPSEILTRFRTRSRPLAVTRDSEGTLAAIRTADWTYVRSRRRDASSSESSDCEQLYEFPGDGREQNDMADRRPETVAELMSVVARADDYSNNDE